MPVARDETVAVERMRDDLGRVNSCSGLVKSFGCPCRPTLLRRLLRTASFSQRRSGETFRFWNCAPEPSLRPKQKLHLENGFLRIEGLGSRRLLACACATAISTRFILRSRLESTSKTGLRLQTALGSWRPTPLQITDVQTQVR